LPTLQSSSNIVLVANGSTSSVDKPGALLEVLEKIGVYKAARTLVQRAVNRYDIALGEDE